MEAVQESTKPKKVQPVCYMCKVPLCNVCGQCETEGCKLEGKSATSKADLINLKYLLADTQKAQGYVAIAEHLNVPTPYRVISDPEDINTAVQAFSTLPDVFVRPCPVRPRHGFVESRPVTGTLDARVDSILKIFEETRKADDKAELLLVPTIKASHNIVLTPARMAVGYGHDGATAGKKSIVIPLAGVPFHEISTDILRRAKVDTAKEDPFMEAVLVDGAKFSNDSTNVLKQGVFLTQLRAGEKIPASVGDDYIPEEMTVRATMEASGDLVEWERQAKQIKEGTVVYLIGGSLISHYGIHCIMNKVPIMTSRKPKVGEVLKVTAKPKEPTVESISKGLAYGAMLPITSRAVNAKDGRIVAGSAITAMIVALHNAAALGGEDGFYLGAAVSIMIRTGMAASHGEARHKHNPGGLSRNQIYEKAFVDFFGSRKTLGRALWLFDHWGGGGGYGGPKWASCTKSVIGLDMQVRKLLKSGLQDDVAKLITALNHSVNQAHNNGWWLNKFVPQRAFDLGSKQSVYTLCIAAPVFAEIAQYESKADWREWMKRWLAEEEIEYKSPSGEGPTVGYTAHDPDDEDCECPICLSGINPADLKTTPGNIGGSVPTDAKTIITHAQVSHIKTTMAHFQFKIEGYAGYFSFDSPYEGGPITGISLPLESYSGSGVMYAPLEVKKVSDGVFVLSHAATGLKVAFNTVTHTAMKVPSDEPKTEK